MQIVTVYPGADAVENITEERLGQSADDCSNCRHRRYGEPVPAEFFADGNDEDPKAAAGPGIDKHDKGHGGDDVPAEVKRRFGGC